MTVGGGSGRAVVPRVTSYTYDADGNVTATSHSASPNLIGTTSGSNFSSSLSLSMPAGTKSGDEAVLTTTTSSGASGLEPATANDIYATRQWEVALRAWAARPAWPSSTVPRLPSATPLVTSTSPRCELRRRSPRSSGTQWGQSMTAGDLYTVAGSVAGPRATPATAVRPLPRSSTALRAWRSMPAATSTSRTPSITGSKKWRRPRILSGAQSMTADDIYTVAGSSTGTSGHSGDGGGGDLGPLERPDRAGLRPGGDLYIGDFSNNRVQEVAATTHSQWGQSMTANDIYTVAGSSSGTSGHAGDGGRGYFGDIERCR